MVTRMSTRPGKPNGARPTDLEASRGERHVLAPRFADLDLVDRIFDYVVAQFPQMRTQLTDEHRLAVREEIAGDRKYYVRTGHEIRRSAVAKRVLELFNGRNATEVARCLGIGRATVYRILKQAGREIVSEFDGI